MNRFFSHFEQTLQNCKQCCLLSFGQSGHRIPVGFLSRLREVASVGLGREVSLRNASGSGCVSAQDDGPDVFLFMKPQMLFSLFHFFKEKGCYKQNIMGPWLCFINFSFKLLVWN